MNTNNKAERKPMFKVGETYKTRGGLDARLLYRRGNHKYPLVWIVNPDEKIITTTENGLHWATKECGLDIVPPRQKLWLAACRHKSNGTVKIYGHFFKGSTYESCNVDCRWIEVELPEGVFIEPEGKGEDDV